MNDRLYTEAELAEERAKLFEVFKAGWEAAAKIVEGELKDPGRGWNDCDPSNQILLGMREGLQTAINTIHQGRQPSWMPHGRLGIQEVFDAWLQRQVDDVDVVGREPKEAPRKDPFFNYLCGCESMHGRLGAHREECPTLRARHIAEVLAQDA